MRNKVHIRNRLHILKDIRDISTLDYKFETYIHYKLDTNQTLETKYAFDHTYIYMTHTVYIYDTHNIYI